MEHVPPRALLKAGRRPSTALAHIIAQFLDQRLSKSTLRHHRRNAVWLWSGGAGGSFHPLWLRDNCPSAPRGEPAEAGQRGRDFGRPRRRIGRVRAERLRVRWHPDGHVSEFCAAWLRSSAGRRRRRGRRGRRGGRGGRGGAAPPPTLPEFEYSSCGRRRRRRTSGCALAAHGAALLRGVPCEEHRVAEVAELIGPLQPQIYGDTFDVRSPRPINLAYTGEAIGPHMDLCYYESPPGLQLLLHASTTPSPAARAY